MDTFGTLLALADVVQKKLFSQWVASEAAPRDSDALEPHSVAQIDLHNSQLIDTLRRRFKRNVRVINFWLQHCCFPKDMGQYPQRLKASAWNLPGPRSIGFSGTNDLHRLLPSQVQQRFDVDDELLATNGKMLQLMCRNGA